MASAENEHESSPAHCVALSQCRCPGCWTAERPRQPTAGRCEVLARVTMRLGVASMKIALMRPNSRVEHACLFRASSHCLFQRHSFAVATLSPRFLLPLPRHHGFCMSEKIPISLDCYTPQSTPPRRPRSRPNTEHMLSSLCHVPRCDSRFAHRHGGSAGQHSTLSTTGKQPSAGPKAPVIAFTLNGSHDITHIPYTEPCPVVPARRIALIFLNPYSIIQPWPSTFTKVRPAFASLLCVHPSGRNPRLLT